MTTTVQTDEFFTLCERLFADYPLAINWKMRRGVSGSASVVRVITLEWWEGGKFQYFSVLHRRQSDSSMDMYAMTPFPADDATVGIAESGLVGFDPIRSSYRSSIRDHFMSAMPRYLKVLLLGTPMPREQSLFGCFRDGVVTFMLQVHSNNVDSAFGGYQLRESGTPDFWVASDTPPGPTRLQLFWDQVSSATIAPLDRIIADSPNGVWWLRFDSCDTAVIMVSDQIGSLGRGVYETRPSGVSDPLEALLSRNQKVDLVARMQRLTRGIERKQNLAGLPSL